MPSASAVSFSRTGNRAGALRVTLLVYYLWKGWYGQVFEHQPRWIGSIAGSIGWVFNELNEAIGNTEPGHYEYPGIEKIGATLENDPSVKRFLTKQPET